MAKGGRLVLVKRVLCASPVYTKMSLDLAAKVVEGINKIPLERSCRRQGRALW